MYRRAFSGLHIRSTALSAGWSITSWWCHQHNGCLGATTVLLSLDPHMIVARARDSCRSTHPRLRLRRGSMFVPRPKLFRLTGLSRFYLGDEPICLAQPLFKSANMSALTASAPWLRELHEHFVACRPTIGSPKRTHWPSTDEHFFLDDDLDKGLKQSKECVTQILSQR